MTHTALRFASGCNGPAGGISVEYVRRTRSRLHRAACRVETGEGTVFPRCRVCLVARVNRETEPGNRAAAMAAAVGIMPDRCRRNIRPRRKARRYFNAGRRNTRASVETSRPENYII